MAEQPVSISTSGDNIVIAGQQRSPIYIRRIALVLAAETTVQFKRGSQPISGPMQILTLDLEGNPLYVANAGDAFVITLGASVQCGGTVWYTYG